MNLHETSEVGDQPEASSPLPRAVFFAGPAVLVVARLLLEPLGDADWDRTLTDVASHRARSDAGWLLAILGCGLMSLGSGSYMRLIGLGGVSTLVTMPGPVRSVLVAASVLLAVGHWLALRPRVSPSPAAPAGLDARRPRSA